MRTWAGVVAAAAAIAVSQLVAALLGVVESPVLAVAQLAVQLTPGGVAEPVIATVGRADKPIAIVVTLLAIVALGAVIGRWWPSVKANALVVVLIVLSAAAVVARPNTTVGGLLACAAGGLVLAGVLGLLIRTPSTHARPDAEDADGRRRFLRLSGLLALGAVVAGGLGEVLSARSARRADVERARSVLASAPGRVPAPAGTDLGIAVQPRWKTPNGEFYRIDTALTVPLIDPADWTLRIHGMVDRPMTLTYKDLVDRGLKDAWITMCCVSNPVGGDLISNTVFSGVPIADILKEVGVQADADCLFSTSDDGWTCGTPVSALTDGRDALLALEMDGVPLPIEHGFPVRQVVPGLYGYVSGTKWVVDWELTQFSKVSAYWTDRGWAEQGPIKTESRIDVPRSDVKAGRVPVAGVAWAPHRGIEGVEVRVDGGRWQEATLARVPSTDTWVQWSWDWDASEGDHVVEVRAIDKGGEPQTAVRAEPIPDGASGWHRISVSVS
ncbi:hypothetical protein ASD11_01805 [Aeromicrobium sp. Root495]|nr:hypothetical protein ASD11_01805 [Aeromicrobium sp. Root495]